jgi:hypothetical protein
MASMRQRRVRGVGSLLLALLLLVPVAASGHRHTGHSGTPCATCAVTNHTPVVHAAGIALPATDRVVLGVETASSATPVTPSIRHATGRAPPSSRLLGP